MPADDNATRAAKPPLSLIGLPYLYGRRQVSPRNEMARGPHALLSNARLLEGLDPLFGDIATVMIEDVDDPAPEQTAGYDSPNVTGYFAGDQLSRMLVQNARLAEEVRRARRLGRIPLAATGACSAAVGMVAGLDDAGEIGMVWLDAHDDAETPETSLSGLMEGMPVAMVAGRCWQAYCGQIPGFRPIPPERILTIGLHEQYDARPERGSRTPGSAVGPDLIRQQGFEPAVAAAVEALAARCGKVYVHVDVDVLDPAVAQVSHHTAEGGLTLAQLDYALRAVAERLEIVALDFSAFDPSIDADAPDVIAGAMVDASKAILASREG